MSIDMCGCTQWCKSKYCLDREDWPLFDKLVKQGFDPNSSTFLSKLEDLRLKRTKDLSRESKAVIGLFLCVAIIVFMVLSWYMVKVWDLF